MINLFRRVTIAALLCLFALCPSARAEDVVVVLHPATGLAPEAIEFDQRQKPPPEFVLAALTKRKLRIVVGKSAKEAPGGRVFILELEDPKTISVPKIQFGEDPMAKGGFKKAALRYNQLVVVEPYSLWHRAGADAEPELMGRAILWGQEEPLHSTGSGSTTIISLTKETPADLTEKYLRRAVFDIPRLLSHAVAEKLVVAKGKPNITMEGVSAWAKKLPPIFDSTKLEGGKLKVDPRGKAPPAALSVTFSPARVVKADDGGVVVEVDMSNQLPVRALGMLRRQGSKAEGELDNALRKKGIGPFTKSRGSRFDLAPGEKMVAKFQIPKELSSDPAFFRDNEITVDLAALGDMVKERTAKEPPKKAKKK